MALLNLPSDLPDKFGCDFLSHKLLLCTDIKIPNVWALNLRTFYYIFIYSSIYIVYPKNGNDHLALLISPTRYFDRNIPVLLMFWSLTYLFCSRDTITNSFQNKDRGAILTTHYMEEADALCSRVGIMVNGKLEWVKKSTWIL